MTDKQDTGPRTVWSKTYVQNLRAQGKYLAVFLDEGEPWAANPDSVKLADGFVITEAGGDTVVTPIPAGSSVRVHEMSDDALNLMVQEFHETGEGNARLRDIR